MNTSIKTENGRDVRVLVVDDEEEIRELLSGFLRDTGFEVAVACTGNEALSQATQFSPHVILLDIILPDIDGISVYETLRKNRIQSKIPIVFFSALAENRAVMFSKRIRGSAPYSLIPKPVSTNLLIKEIQKLLNASTNHMDSN
ncbi:MAG: response regulator [Candidatus Omnitrophica bacterium]|nr:response regulator [Candidatus Omnitrophota bacterium]